MEHADAFIQRLAADQVRRRGRAPVQTGHMTWTKLVRLIRCGYGQGHLEKYLPWRRVTKRDISQHANMSHLPAPEYGHKHHPRSRAQRHLLNRLAWCGAFDVRDHYPVWPWPHEHPLEGLLGTSIDRLTRGTFEIGSECGILPSLYPGTNLPRVITFHSLATLVDIKWRVRLAAYQIDSSEAEEVSEIRRSRELNVLRSRYCSEAGIDFRLVGERELNNTLSTNLDALRPKATREATARMRQSALYDYFLKACQDEAYHTSPHHVIEALSRKLNVQQVVFQNAYDVARWFQDLDHDLSLPLEPWNPLVLGGVGLRDAVRQRLFGTVEV
jgi:hypothetical protein